MITDTLGASGDHSATVPAGATTIDVVNSTLPAGSFQTADMDPTTVIVPGGGIVTDVDGYQLKGTDKHLYLPLVRAGR